MPLEEHALHWLEVWGSKAAAPGVAEEAAASPVEAPVLEAVSPVVAEGLARMERLARVAQEEFGDDVCEQLLTFLQDRAPSSPALDAFLASRVEPAAPEVRLYAKGRSQRGRGRVWMACVH